MKKIKEYAIRILVVFMVLAYLALGLLIVNLYTTNKKQKELIESQVATIIKNKNEDCYCGWYEDFYYEHAAEVGAYE